MTTPIWNQNDKIQISQFSPLKNNSETDICIVGGGMGGISTAYLLSKSGYAITLIEANEICSGETSRTSAHLFSAVDDHFHLLEKSHGLEAAKVMADSHKAAIDLIEKISKDENISCDFKRLDGYLFLGPEHSKDFLEKELFSARECGMNVQMTTVPFPKASNSNQALKFSNQAQFHPLKYMKGLTEACVRNGVKIYTHTRAVEFTDGDIQIVKTDNGHTIKAKHLVIATNTPVTTALTFNTKYEAFRSYMIAAKIPKGSVPECLYWSTSDPYEYVRITDGDTSDSDYLLVGGQDHYVGKHINYDERFNNLIQWASERFPITSSNVVSKWSGQINEPVDSIGFLGRNPGCSNNSYIISGDSGNGMTHTHIGAMIISDYIHGKEHKWAKIFDPSRMMTAEKLEFIKHNLHVQMQFKDWVTPGEISDIEDLKVGCGAIMRTGLKKVAVYKDDKGIVHQHSAVCPHLGAIISWNDLEKSFDCPAHGSRFNAFGEAICGPTSNNLTKCN